MRIVNVPLSKARTTSHRWAYRFVDGEPYIYPSGETAEIVPGTECRNTGCCDNNGTPIYEHDYLERWQCFGEGKEIYRGIGEMVYIDGILNKRITGKPDVPVAYSYRHDISNPLRLYSSKVVGNSLVLPLKTGFISSAEFDKQRKKIKKL